MTGEHRWSLAWRTPCMPAAAFEPQRTFREALATLAKLRGGHGFKASIRPMGGPCYCGACKELRRSVSA